MSGYVYFFETGEGLVKIGKANDVEKRFKQIQTACPTGLRNIGSIPSEYPYVLEKEIHDLLSHYRKNGEWFDIPDFMRADIVHQMRMKFDADYKNESMKRSREKEFEKNGYIVTRESWEPEDCPHCGNGSHHLKGVYDLNKKNAKYEEIVILQECEYCLQLFGNYEAHGKGGKNIGRLIVRDIPATWKRLF